MARTAPSPPRDLPVVDDLNDSHGRANEKIVPRPASNPLVTKGTMARRCKGAAMTTSASDVRLNFSTGWTYAPAPETAKVEIKTRYDLFVGGKFVPPARGEYPLGKLFQGTVCPSLQPSGTCVATPVGSLGWSKTPSPLSAI